MKRVGLLTEPAALEEMPPVLLCPHCGKEYRNAAALRAHCRKEHPQQLDEEEPDAEH